ncbi:MAG: ATP-binding protein, partial [Planctomycetota bacterium]
MNGVIGMCQLLGNSGLNQEQSGYQQLALKSARDLLALLNDILDFSKMEAGKLELQIESIDLHELLSDTTRLLSAPAAEKELELILRITADVPKFVKTDATRLRQVIFNLIGNAVKFTEAGEVELSLTIDETSDHDAKRVRFSVRDTGIGISEIEQTRIFESFEQVTTGGEHHRGGTGLGLAISKRILELFGAELNVQSEPGRGSTFSFEIAMEVMPNLVEHDPTMDHLNEKTVLIVDDNQTSRRYFREVATSMGMRAEVATDGAKAVNVIATRTHQNQPFDLLMIDDGLDGIGIEEILQALSESGAPQSSVLLLTTVDRTSSLSPQASKTVNRVLMKPMSRDELTSAMLAAVAPKLGLTMEDLVAASTSTLETARQAKRVLLAEDNAINRAIVFNLLTDRGHSVDVVADGNAVLRRVARTTYDVVLMDIQMPKLDGLR